MMLWSVPEKLPRIRPPAAEIASIVSPHAGSTGLDGMYWGADMGRYVMKFVVLSQPAPAWVAEMARSEPTAIPVPVNLMLRLSTP